LFPILFTVPDFSAMGVGSQILEVAVGLACALGWLALHLRRRHGAAASLLNLAAFLVLLHVALSFVMGRDVTVYSFGVLIVVGFFAGAWWLLRETRALGMDDKRVFDWAFWMLVVGIVGSRVLYAYLNYDRFANDKLAVLQVWKGGLVWYGGLIPAVLVGMALASRWKLPVWKLADAGAAAVMLALAVGRWACFLAGDDYGRPTDLPLGVRFTNPASLVPSGLLGTPLHPTQLYMSVACLWIFFVVARIRARSVHAGTAFAWMLILYAVTRGVVIEPLRGDFVERNPSLGSHAVAPLVFEKGPDTPALSMQAGTRVHGDPGGDGRLLEPLELAAGEDTSTLVHALADDADPSAPAVDPHEHAGGAAPPAPEWSVRGVEGLPEGVRIRNLPARWYRSDLPAPPGYVSTSQWLSILVLLAGIALLARLRRREA